MDRLHARRPADEVVALRRADRPTVQPKLRVGAVDDPAEREADRIAKCISAALKTGSVTPDRGGPGRVRRAARTADAGGAPVTADVEQRITRARRSGSALSSSVADTMGSAFGADFARVRVHTDSTAGELSRSLNARAFTVGNDVFFGDGEYRPETGSGRELLAHELTHTLQQGGDGTAARTIRRWDLRGQLDIDNATRVSTIRSGQAVFFLDDANGDRMVVKGDNVPVGMNQLFATVHDQVSGTQSVLVRALPGAEKARLKALIARAPADPSWDALFNADPPKIDYAVSVASANNTALVGGKPTTPDKKARLFHIEQLDGLPKVIAMSNAAAGGADDIETVMQRGASQGDAGGARTSRSLFGDPEHMRQLGQITAADLFLGNEDRVRAGNFGNWFVDPQGAITLIDHVDATAKGEMQLGDVATGALNQMKSSALAKTAKDCVGRIVRGMVRLGDAKATEWAAETVKGKPRRAVMEAAFLAGLKAGRKRIIKLYATGKSGRTGRNAKAAAQATQAADTAAGDGTQTDYWETMKARARWLAKN